MHHDATTPDWPSASSSPSSSRRSCSLERGVECERRREKKIAWQGLGTDEEGTSVRARRREIARASRDSTTEWGARASATERSRQTGNAVRATERTNMRSTETTLIRAEGRRERYDGRVARLYRRILERSSLRAAAKWTSVRPVAGCTARISVC